jgi:hypothetical protein
MKRAGSATSRYTKLLKNPAEILSAGFVFGYSADQVIHLNQQQVGDM